MQATAMLFFSLLPLFATSQDPPEFAEPKISTERFQITGSVINSVTGASVRRALVTAQGYPGPSQAAFTTEDGRFTFSGLPAGTYRLSAARPGIRGGRAGRRASHSTGCGSFGGANRR